MTAVRGQRAKLARGAGAIGTHVTNVNDEASGTKGAIEWTEVTWRPVTGGDRVAVGWGNCYVLALAWHLGQ